MKTTVAITDRGIIHGNEVLGAPKFTHDCTRCIFLGKMLCNMGNGTDIVDVYYCRDAITLGKLGSCIVRFGNDGPDYWSCPAVLLMQTLSMSVPAQTFWACVTSNVAHHPIEVRELFMNLVNVEAERVLRVIEV